MIIAPLDLIVVFDFIFGIPYALFLREHDKIEANVKERQNIKRLYNEI